MCLRGGILLRFNKLSFFTLMIVLFFAISAVNASDAQLDDAFALDQSASSISYSDNAVLYVDDSVSLSDDAVLCGGAVSDSNETVSDSNGTISTSNGHASYSNDSVDSNNCFSYSASVVSTSNSLNKEKPSNLKDNQNSIYVDSINGDDSNSGHSKTASLKTLNKAIYLANNGDMIYLSSGRYSGLENTRINLTKSLSFIGSEGTFIDGENVNYLFIIQDGLSVSFKGIYFAYGYKSPDSFSITYDDNIYGSALDIKNSTVTVDSCRFINNTIMYGTKNIRLYGGAISNFGELTVLDSYFENNTAKSTNGVFSYGGCIYNNGKLLMNGTVLNNSYSSDYGYGAGFANDGEAIVDSSIIANSNSTQECRGSGIYNLGDLLLANSIIEKNFIKRANFDFIFGAIYNGGNLTGYGNIFRNNSADYLDPITAFRGSPNIYNVGNLNLSYNAFIDNEGYSGISPDLYIYAGDIIELDNNWWNTNNNPYDDSKVNLDIVDSWLVFNLSPEYSKLNIGENIEISAFFTSSGGRLGDLNLLPVFNVTFDLYDSMHGSDSVSGSGSGSISGSSSQEEMSNHFNFTKELKGGKASFIFTNSSEKSSWILTAILCSFNQSAIIDVGKIDTEILVEVPSKINYVDDLNVSIEITASDSSIPKGNLTLFCNDNEYPLILKEAKANLTISNLIPGESLLKIIYNGNDDYFKAFYNKTIYVEKLPVSMDLEIAEIKVDQKASAIVSINTEGAYGLGRLYIDGKAKKNVYLYNGNTTIQLNNFAEGDYNITVEFLETQFYKPSNASAVLKVRKYPSSLNLTVDDIFYGETAKILIDVGPESLIGEAELIIARDNMTIDLDGYADSDDCYSQSIYLNNATTRVNLEGFHAGTYSVLVLFKGDSRYYPSNASGSFSVYKTNSSLNVTVDYDEENLNGTIMVKTIPNNCSGTVGVYINFNEYQKNLTDGQAIFNVSFDRGTNYVFVYYEGDDYYYGSNWNTTIGVADDFVLLGKNVTAYQYNDFYYSIRLLEPSGVPLPARNVTFTFNGKSTNVLTDENGFADFKLNLNAGVYNISARYKDSTINNSLTVNEIRFNLTSTNISYGDLEEFKAIFDNNIYGKVNFIIDGILDETVDIINKTAIFDTYSLNAGNYTLKAIYRNDKFNSREAISKFSISKSNLSYNVSSNEISPGDYPIIKLNGLENATGNVSFKFNGTSYNREIINGESVLNLSIKLPKGTYSLDFAYPGDRNYNGFDGTLDLYVKDSFTALRLEINDASYNEDIIAIARVNLNATGYVEFSVYDYESVSNLSDGIGNAINGSDLSDGVGNAINGSDLSDDMKNNLSNLSPILSEKVQIKDGIAKWNFTGLNVGKYYLAAIYLGDNYYLSSTNSSLFNIDKANSSILLFTNGAYLNENIRIFARLSDNATGYISFSMLGYYSPRDKKIINSSSMWYISPLDNGNYTVTARYAGDDNYNPSNVSYTLTVGKYKSLLNVDIKDSGIYDDIIARVSLKSTIGDRISGRVNLTVSSPSSNEIYLINVFNGETNVTLKKYGEGNYSYFAYYDGDENYSNSSYRDEFGVSDDFKVELSSKGLVKYYGEDKQLIVSIISNSSLLGEKINIIINDKSYQSLINSTNKASFDLNISFGNYTGTISLDESSKYHSPSIEANITVHPTVEAFDFTKVYGSSSKYYAIFCDSNGKLLSNETVLIKVLNKTYKRTTSSDGIASLNINLNPGTYLITATNPLTGETRQNRIYVFKYLMENKNISQYYSYKATYKVRAYDRNGNIAKGVTVNIKVGSKTYKKTTDNEGYARLNINLMPGNYVIKASYNNYTVSNKITVKHLLDANNIIAKKSLKKITVKVSLKKVNGNALKNKKITLKFNKKTYSAKTNSNGVATFSISQVVYKNLKKNKNYAYTVSYNKDSLKRTIKFK